MRIVVGMSTARMDRTSIWKKILVFLQPGTTFWRLAVIESHKMKIFSSLFPSITYAKNSASSALPFNTCVLLSTLETSLE